MKQAKLRLVMGNPSCDQDSFIGAHVLGVVRNRVPVVNLSRTIFACKKDLVEIVQLAGLTVEDLVFLEQQGEDWCLIHRDGVLKVQDKPLYVSIVDHNLPAKSLLACPTFTVDQIIDHHPMLELNPMYSKVKAMTINLNAGSCCSLIYQDIKDHLGQRLEEHPEEYRFLVLLTIPILTDTSLLTSRTHGVDKAAVEHLLQLAGLTADDAKQLHQHLKKRKKCEAEIPCEYILQMDYKGFEYPAVAPGKTYGISSIKYPYDEWVQRDGKDRVLATIDAFMKEHQHEFFLVNCKANGIREMLVHRPPGADFAQQVFYDGQPVEQRALGNDPAFTLYRVDPLLSRKLVAPKILNYLKTHHQEE